MKKILLLSLTVFLFTSCSSGEEDVTKVSLIKQNRVAEDAKSKIDSAIAVMNIIKEDIDELDKEGLLEEESQDLGTRAEQFEGNIDKLIKILNILKEDVREMEKMEEGAEQ